MSNMQDQIEKLIDAQLALENVYDYSDKYMRDLGRLADSSRATLNNLASTVVKNAK